MKVALAAVAFTVLVLGFSSSQSASRQSCQTGRALGFATLRFDPPYVAGTMPSTLTSASGFFFSRYNCRGQGVLARRVSLGHYQVRFPGLRIHALAGDAISPDGISSSVAIEGIDTVGIFLRGPLDGSEVASRRDVAFSVIVY